MSHNPLVAGSNPAGPTSLRIAKAAGHSSKSGGWHFENISQPLMTG